MKNKQPKNTVSIPAKPELTTENIELLGMLIKLQECDNNIARLNSELTDASNARAELSRDINYFVQYLTKDQKEKSEKVIKETDSPVNTLNKDTSNSTITDQILSLLSDGSQHSTREIMNAVNTSPAYVSKILSDLHRRGTIDHPRHGIWQFKA